MLLLSIYVLYSNVTYIIMSCIKLFQIVVSNNDIIQIIYTYFHCLLNKWTDHWWLVKTSKHHNGQGKKFDHPF